MKTLLLALGAALLVAASSHAQSFTEVYKAGAFLHRRADITATTTISGTPVVNTSSAMTIGVSATAVISATVDYLANDYRLLSSTSVWAYQTSKTLIHHSYPLWFARVRVTPGSAIGAQTLSVDLINSK